MSGGTATDAKLLGGATSANTTLTGSFTNSSPALNGSNRISDISRSTECPSSAYRHGQTDIFVLQISIANVDANSLLGLVPNPNFKHLGQCCRWQLRRHLFFAGNRAYTPADFHSAPTASTPASGAVWAVLNHSSLLRHNPRAVHLGAAGHGSCAGCDSPACAASNSKQFYLNFSRKLQLPLKLVGIHPRHQVMDPKTCQEIHICS